MSRHVAPHRWADAFAGKLADADVAVMDRHAEQCPRCARARKNVQRTSQSFPTLRAQSAPELPWDSVRARVHWSVSTERHAKVAPPSQLPGWIVATAFATSGIALAIVTDPLGAPSTPSAAPIAAAEGSAIQPAPEPPAPVAGIVSRFAGQVLIDGVRRTDAFEHELGVGTVLATGDGRIDVQFGDHSAFALAPNSTLVLRRFDAEQIELAVDGTVDIALATRAPNQRFIVLAGERTVEVRGTQFRVSHDATATKVACRHGKVAVRDAHGELEVEAARKLDVPATTQVASARVAALSVAELELLAEATPAMIPIWTDATTLVKTSAELEIATTGRRHVRVDGVEVGEGPLRVRVMPGRHTVDTADAAGRFRRAGWVDVSPSKPARLAVAADTAPTGGTAARKRELHSGIDRARLARCTRALAKAGLSSFVQIEISVDETGAIGFLNVIDTDLSSTTASCVRDVLAEVQFRPGTAATFRDKLDL